MSVSSVSPTNCTIDDLAGSRFSNALNTRSSSSSEADELVPLSTSPFRDLSAMADLSAASNRMSIDLSPLIFDPRCLRRFLDAWQWRSSRFFLGLGAFFSLRLRAIGGTTLVVSDASCNSRATALRSLVIPVSVEPMSSFRFNARMSRTSII